VPSEYRKRVLWLIRGNHLLFPIGRKRVPVELDASPLLYSLY